MTWREQAACLGLDSDIFFPGDDQKKQLAAVQICETCKVHAECLEYALMTKCDEGIFGGTTPKQRRAIKRKRGRR